MTTGSRMTVMLTGGPTAIRRVAAGSMTEVVKVPAFSLYAMFPVIDAMLGSLD